MTNHWSRKIMSIIGIAIKKPYFSLSFAQMLTMHVTTRNST